MRLVIAIPISGGFSGIKKIDALDQCHMAIAEEKIKTFTVPKGLILRVTVTK